MNYFATVNRRHFLELSERKIKRTHTSNGHASILLFDIDHFKKINDQHGHLVGDKFLQGITKIFMDNLRTGDILGRFGGEEFVFLLPKTKLEDARNIAERLRHLIAKTPIESEIGPIKTTISIGLTLMERAHSVTVEQMLYRADRAI